MRTLRRHAFSLVELLTVIGIVAVLLSLLLPALANARAQAARVGCMSNLRQLLQAQMMYVADNNGYLTYPNWGHDRSSADVWAVGWLYAQGKVSVPPKAEDVTSGALYRYLKNTRVFQCPVKEAGEWSAEGTDRLTSYIMNGAVCGYGSVGSRVDPGVRLSEPSWKITSWTDPSRQVLWWEAEEAGLGGAAWNDGASMPRENLLARRHGRGASIACFDGHVEWMDRIEYVREYQRPGPNRLWCDPRRPDGGRSL